MKKLIIATATIILSFILTESSAQRKNVGGELAIGARLGGSSGLTLKKYSGNGHSAFEFIGAWSFDNDLDGFTLTGLWGHNHQAAVKSALIWPTFIGQGHTVGSMMVRLIISPRALLKKGGGL